MAPVRRGSVTRNLFVCYRHAPGLVFAGITEVPRTVCPQCVKVAYKIVRRSHPDTSGMSLGEVLAYLD